MPGISFTCLSLSHPHNDPEKVLLLALSDDGDHVRHTGFRNLLKVVPLLWQSEDSNAGSLVLKPILCRMTCMLCNSPS